MDLSLAFIVLGAAFAIAIPTASFFILSSFIAGKLKIKDKYLFWVTHFIIFTLLCLCAPTILLLLYKLVSGIPISGFSSVLETDCGMKETNMNLIACRTLNMLQLLFLPPIGTVFYFIAAGLKRMYFWGARKKNG